MFMMFIKDEFAQAVFGKLATAPVGFYQSTQGKTVVQKAIALIAARSGAQAAQDFEDELRLSDMVDRF